jgi:hypothetical protein
LVGEGQVIKKPTYGEILVRGEVSKGYSLQRKNQGRGIRTTKTSLNPEEIFL